MHTEYKVTTFVPKPPSFGARFLRVDRGWDQHRCAHFQQFLNQHAAEGWRLHSMQTADTIATKTPGSGGCLLCVFEKDAD